jgi:hypothetical protein
LRIGLALAGAIGAAFGCSANTSLDRPGSHAGTGGSIGAGGAVVGPVGGTIGISVPDASSTQDAPTQVSDGAGILNDGRPEVGPGICVPDAGAYAPGPYARRCAAPTDNECNGASDINPALKNGANGNGFDDDCDGKVDEGCACDPAHPVGTTKPCSLVSGSQVDPNTKQPVGWCAINSVGTESCISIGNEVRIAVWDGECRGAQPPFADDVCAPGDFDCDGRDLNSKAQDCACHVDVKCPTDPIRTAPYPDPNNLPAIDGTGWVNGGAANAKNWKWTVTGGDCDNILPHPTFAVYPTKQARLGGPRLSSDTPQMGLGMNANQHGFVVGPAANVGSAIYPAFGLSGDYLVKGEWDEADGHHACTVKVQVRSPGIRVELCWSPMPQDVDLHFARLQNPKSCTHGWFATCSESEDRDDCYFDATSGCTGFTNNPSPWGYARSAPTACHGWGSKRDPTAACDNPRLDQDNITCDPKNPDPMDGEGMNFEGYFCSPENINLDAPKDGEKFAIGVQFYDNSGLPSAQATPKPHVNVYCNGERKLAFGFDPTAVPPTAFPVLRESGLQEGGDIWEVAVVEAKVAAGALNDCVISPVHSKVPKANKDGSKDVCVDTNPQNTAMMGEGAWKFIASGGFPANADALCWH